MRRSNLAHLPPSPTSFQRNVKWLLPWHAAGTLEPADARPVARALALDRSLAGEYRAIQREREAVIEANELLGAPSLRPMLDLFAAIDAEVS